MPTLQLPEDPEQRATAAAKASGISVEALALDAILQRLEDIEDIAAAEAALAGIEAGEKTVPAWRRSSRSMIWRSSCPRRRRGASLG